MAQLRRIVWLALVAGVLAGVAVTLAQWLTTIPLILEAERYEQAETAAGTSDGHAHDHAQDAAAGRTASTLLFNVLAGIGFGLLLSALLATRGASGLRYGLLLGLAAFLAVGLAPALGLPPKLPGTPAATLLDRQLWWVGTAVASAIGLALLILDHRALLKVAGVALLVLPHVIGAPQPDTVVAGGPPAELQQRFIAMSLGATALFWLVLGGVLGWLCRRGREPHAAGAVPSHG